MPRPIKPNSSPARAAAWRDAYGVTEAQAEVVAALIAAQQLGYDGATAEELAHAGVSRSAAYRTAELERARLIVQVGFTDERHPRKVWAPTETAYRRFGVTPSRPVEAQVETAAGHAELMLERMAERKKRQQRAKYQRIREAG